MVSLYLLGRGIKKTKVKKMALIEVGITNIVFFLTFLILAVLWYLQHTNTYITWLLIGISISLALTLSSLATLFAIHLPLSFIVAYACCKRRQKTSRSIYGATTFHQSTDRHQPSFTTWDSPHSSADNEITSLIHDQQQQNYGSNA